MPEYLWDSHPAIGDPNRRRLWLATYRSGGSHEDVARAWVFLQDRLDRLAFVRFLIRTGRLAG